MKYLYSFLIIIFSLQAEIIDTNSFADLKKYIDQETFVILDIDDTLLIPNQMLGCDEWFCQTMQNRIKEGISKKEALDKTLFEWEAIRSITEMKLVEDSIGETIKEVQDMNISMICLTTQRFALGPRTDYQLKKHDITIKKTAPYSDSLYFNNKNLGVLFFEGILFTNGTHKGDALSKFCNLINYMPKKIVFVNDKLTHLKDIEEFCHANNIPFIGLRYGAADDFRKNFNMEIADKQSSNLNLKKISTDLEVL